MLAVTEVTYVGVVLLLLNLPVSVCAAAPGARPVTVDVWTAVMDELVPVTAVPVPVPPADQYAIAAAPPPPTRIAVIAIVAATLRLLILRTTVPPCIGC
jgi:hypothetical protein